jgi:hypothetical protein
MAKNHSNVLQNNDEECRLSHRMPKMAAPTITAADGHNTQRTKTSMPLLAKWHDQTSISQIEEVTKRSSCRASYLLSF